MKIKIWIRAFNFYATRFKNKFLFLSIRNEMFVINSINTK